VSPWLTTALLGDYYVSSSIRHVDGDHAVFKPVIVSAHLLGADNISALLTDWCIAIVHVEVLFYSSEAAQRKRTKTPTTSCHGNT
jgi:hypothetical protein